MFIYCFAQTAITKCPRLGRDEGLGKWEFIVSLFKKLKGQDQDGTRLVPSESSIGSLWIEFSPGVLTRLPLCVCVCPNPFFQGHQADGVGVTITTLIGHYYRFDHQSPETVPFLDTDG